MAAQFTIGLDFGANSVRARLQRDNGIQHASVVAFPHGEASRRMWKCIHRSRQPRAAKPGKETVPAVAARWLSPEKPSIRYAAGSRLSKAEAKRGSAEVSYEEMN